MRLQVGLIVEFGLVEDESAAEADLCEVAVPGAWSTAGATGRSTAGATGRSTARTTGLATTGATGLTTTGATSWATAAGTTGWATAAGARLDYASPGS